MPVQCAHCKKEFTERRYLKSHLSYASNIACKEAFDGVKLTPQKRPAESNDSPSNDGVSATTTISPAPPRKSPSLRETLVGKTSFGDMEDYVADRIGAMFDTQKNYDNTQETHSHTQESSDDGQEMMHLDDDDDDNNNPAEEDEGNQEPELLPDTSVFEDFTQYTNYCNGNLGDLTPEHEAGVELLNLLVKVRAPLRIYNAIFKWHCNNTHVTTFTPKKTLMKELQKRYNMQKKAPKVIKKLLLPHSQSEIDLVYHDFGHQLQSLLAEPRITDDNYLFFDNNPFSPPPELFEKVSDINTGLAYRKSYEALIKKPNQQVLLPIIMYMDGAVTGQFDHLPIEALKFTLGIFNWKTRNKSFAWRNLGYVTKYLKEDTTARKILRESGGIDAKNYLSDDENPMPTTNQNNNNRQNDEDSAYESDEDNNVIGPEAKIITCSGQDLHTMLDNMLATYREYERGITWDLRYKGKTHHVEFIPFLMFIKGDTQEHDKHCGHYTSRTKGVAQLCRYCCCPNDQTDDETLTFEKKHPAMITPLVKAKDMAGLKALSQQYIDNCWYKVRFGSHNQLGVHGACPLEVLHWFQLGKYGGVRNNFFAQAGKDSILSNNMNALAKSMGLLLKRQSDRDMPRTDFSKGVKKGKLMAHEMTGMIVVLAACLRCTKGRNMLLNESLGKQKEFFGSVQLIRGWMELFELLLQWEAWMENKEMLVSEVKLFQAKLPTIMALEKTVGKREEGMKFKTFKFHASLHTADDILNFGVPEMVNTQTDESHHKDSKTAAIHTQRRIKTFCYQTGKNLFEMAIVAIAMQEIYDGLVPWEYFHDIIDGDLEEVSAKKVVDYTDDDDDDDDDDADDDEDGNNTNNSHDEQEGADEEEGGGIDTKNTGVRIRFFYSEQKAGYTYSIKSRMKGKEKFHLDKQVVAFVGDVFDEFGEEVQELRMFTEHKREGQIFRASPCFLSKPWYDWVMINWGDEGGVLPAQIWGFIDLTEIPPDLTREPATYAIIESAKPNKTQQEKGLSLLFEPFLKEHNGITANGEVDRKFYLVDTNSFVAPTIMFPDVGNKNKAAYLRIKPRDKWASMFSDWLKEEDNV